MAPSPERFAARLALLPHAELIELAARGCHDIPAFRRDVDAELAIRTPTSDKALDKVLLSPDLAPYIFASLEVEDHAAALACKAWGVAWKARAASFRILRPAPCPAPDFELKTPRYLAALPGGEQMAIATRGHRVYIVDKEMKLQRTLGDAASGVAFRDVCGLAAGDDGLHVAEWNPARLRRFTRDTYAVAAEHTSEEHSGFYDLALAPGGVLFVVTGGDDTWELLALDALSLEVRFTVGEDVLGRGDLWSLAVCGDEVYVGNERDRSIHVLSLDGKPRRVLTSQPGGWRMPESLCCAADRLYLIEGVEYGYLDEAARAKQLTGRRIFVLTPEGRTLQVYNSPRPLEEKVEWRGMCHLDGKLMVADEEEEQHEVLALQGL